MIIISTNIDVSTLDPLFSLQMIEDIDAALEDLNKTKQQLLKNIDDYEKQHQDN